ncbi:hypothetical protein GCM10010174_00340 [Kutzneria viridogrisea]|uniref:Uncharacterized protein n=1 Tax=Kutzneria viridogrisea TaxID=47990 RepID=A0ABR6BCJ4_9PSEU|nr:hypothetical protein [Kutzneria albida]MBA8924552.1 hypothetical protein [Kutzneria viridogrisea]
MERNRTVRAHKLLELWGYLLTRPEPEDVEEIRTATGATLGLATRQSFHLYVRALAELEMVVILESTSGAPRKLYSGAFPRTLSELDRTMLRSWTATLPCRPCRGEVQLRLTGGCPADAADHRALPPLPVSARELLSGLDGLYEPRVRAIWAEMLSIDEDYSLFQILGLARNSMPISSSQTVGRYLRGMRKAGLIRSSDYLHGTGKVYQGCFPRAVTDEDYLRLQPWLRTLPQERARVVLHRWSTRPRPGVPITT